MKENEEEQESLAADTSEKSMYVVPTEEDIAKENLYIFITIGCICVFSIIITIGKIFLVDVHFYPSIFGLPAQGENSSVAGNEVT